MGRFQECAKYMSFEQIGNFLDAAIRNRIAVRLIAEQHIVLSRALQNPEQANTDVGIVDMALSPVEMIRMCSSFVSELCEATLGAAPPIVIDGTTDATFAYVYILLRKIPQTDEVKPKPKPKITHEFKIKQLRSGTYGIHPD
jgi:26S proteasome regulatory subunit T1